MKKFNLTLRLLLILTVSGLSHLIAQDGATTQVRELEPFERVVASNGINVKLFDNDLEEADIKVSGIPLDYIITEVEGKTLKVRMKVSVKNSGGSVMVKVSYKQLTSLQAITGGTIESGRKIETDKLELSASTGGSIKLEVEAKEIEASAKAGCEILLYGKSDKLTANGVLGGNVKAYGLITKSVKASASGGSTVEVYGMEEADVKASLGAEVRVKGSPYEVKKKESTGGVVKILNKPEHGKDLIRDEK